MTIDEAIAHAKEQSEIFGGTHGEFLANVSSWLEELKAIKSDGFTDDLLNMGYTKGYRKAIDEFASELINHAISADIGKGHIMQIEFVAPVTRIDELAEHMKAGRENEY